MAWKNNVVSSVYGEYQFGAMKFGVFSQTLITSDTELRAKCSRLRTITNALNRLTFSELRLLQTELLLKERHGRNRKKEDMDRGLPLSLP